MEEIQDLIDLSKGLARYDLNREAQIAIGKTSKEMIKTQQKQRWEAGMDGRGVRMKPYKSATYRELKINEGHNDVTDLNLTGETDSKMFVDVEGDNFVIDSTGELVPKLESKYGTDIYGLAPTYMDEYFEQSFFPQLQKQIEDLIGLKLD